MLPIVNPMMMTGAGPLMSSYPAYGYGMMGGMYNRWGGGGRWGYGPGYGIAGSFYNNPYSYMTGTYW
jgi:hypothetical protein